MREIGKHPTNAEDSPLTRLQIICPQVLLGIGLRNPDLEEWKLQVLGEEDVWRRNVEVFECGGQLGRDARRSGGSGWHYLRVALDLE